VRRGMPARPSHPKKTGPVFALGDVVQLKSGGVVMTAGRFDPRKGRQCLWSVKGDIYEWLIPEECLRSAQEDGPLVIRWANEGEGEGG
jgi:hypothetical protein